MAPIVMHAVIGERVYPQIEPLVQTRAFGSFLLGCMLADVNAFSDLDRRQTHFAGRPNEDGEDAFYRGSTTFLSRLDDLLQLPWADLVPGEQAFVAGYLCHLAADEAWKAIAWRALWEAGITSADQLPVPGNVLLTAYSVLSVDHVGDPAALSAALRQATVPDVLTHIPHEALVHMWRIVKPRALDGRTTEGYLAMLEQMGLPADEVADRRRQHELYMNDAIALIQESFDVQKMIEATVERSLELVPWLWLGQRSSCA
jgi:hypothetical protein